jgi:hypothetical protein
MSRCPVGYQKMECKPLLLPYMQELQIVQRKLHGSEHQLGEDTVFCWVDTSQPGTSPHHLLCTQDLQEWAKYLVRICLQELYYTMLMNFSMKHRIQTMPHVLHYPVHLTLTSFEKHRRTELRYHFSACLQRSYHLSYIITFTSHLLSTTHWLLVMAYLSGNKTMALNHSKGHMHSTWRVKKNQMITCNCCKVLMMSLQASMLTTLL